MAPDTVPAPDLDAAASAVGLCQAIVDAGARHLAANGGVDANQVVAYDLAHAAAAVATARATLDYGATGDVEARIACAFAADAAADLVGRLVGRAELWGADPATLSPSAAFVAAHRHPEALAALCGEEGPRHLGEDLELARETFHRFAANEIRPHAEHVHRTNADIPEEIIAGLAALGGFGL
ncbi:MAG: acyl-CoA dehydrogenase family protein, partial [Acidimicrobiales bacterium]